MANWPHHLPLHQWRSWPFATQSPDIEHRYITNQQEPNMASRKTPKKDLAAATVLGTFEGSPIIESSIAIVGAGDGLSKALEVDPVLIGLGDRKFVVLETHASQVKFKAHKDAANMLVKTIVLSADVATIVDEDLVRDVLDAQITLQEEAAGIKKLPLDGDPED
jgi:hypothetical protein